MQHEPRPVINMEKQVRWSRKLGGMESLGISKVHQRVLARLVESQIWHQPASSVGGGFTKGTVASACPDARHFSFSLKYVPGAFPASTPVLEVRGSESE